MATSWDQKKVDTSGYKINSTALKDDHVPDTGDKD